MHARSLRLIIFFVLCASAASGQLVFRASVMDTANARPESTNVDLTSIPGRAILPVGQNQNIAKGKAVYVKYGSTNQDLISKSASSKASNLTDGIESFSNFLELLPGQEGTKIQIDLGAIRLVNRIAIISQSVDFRAQGYSLFVGLDTLHYERVKVVTDNDVKATDDFFNPDTARFVLVQIDKINPSGGISTIITEIKIYAIGYLSGAIYTSKVKDLGKTVNWGQARWWADTPSETEVRFQLRTGSAATVDATWSDWSPEVSLQNGLFDAREPRRYMQFRSTLYTNSLNTPRLDSLQIDYDTLLVAASSSGRVTPKNVEILKDTRVAYDIDLTFNSRSLGVDSVVLLTTVPIVIADASLGGTAIPFSVVPSAGRVAIGFPAPILTDGTLTIGIKITPVLLNIRIPSMIVSNQTGLNPQNVDVTTSSTGESWTLSTVGVPESIISIVTADPNPFTPNGDGRNDQTEISFFVTNLLEPKPVRLNVYDLTGRQVRTLVDGVYAAKAFVEQDAIIWNGRDDNGKLMPPGLYVYQIVVDIDGLRPAVLTKTVTIAY